MMQKIGKFLLRVLLCFFIVTIAWVVIYRFVPIPVTFLMAQRCVEQKLDGKPLRLKKDWEPLNKISNKLQLAVVTSEDQNFLWHHGFDLEAIKKAVKYNKKQRQRKKTKMRGASTISQQVAKNTFLFPSRNFVRKGLEVYFTVLIEVFWSKERIMEVYLNVIEMGDGIYGAEAASQYYFHKSASKLNNGEAALIAACLPNPIRFKANAPSSYILSRKVFIQAQMQNWGGKLDYDLKPFEDEK